MIEIGKAVEDLQAWETFGLAGRLQKPVLPFISESDEVEKAMQANLQNALALAIFMQYHKQGPIDLESLFVEIC